MAGHSFPAAGILIAASSFSIPKRQEKLNKTDRKALYFPSKLWYTGKSFIHKGGGRVEALNISRRQAVQWVVCLLAFAFLTRLCIGMLYYNTFDVNWYKTWALELQNGFFDCYSRMTDGKYALDYPPVYLVFLFIVGKLYGALPLADYKMFDMLAMKFFPILFDVLAAGMLYLLCRKKSEGMGVLAAALWALNPSSIFNSACWGQTDGMMLCLLLLAFYLVDADRPILGSVLFAVTAILSSFMLSGELPAIRGWLRRTVRPAWLEKLQTLGGHVRTTLGGWLRAQLKLMGITFLILNAGLLLLRVRYPVLAALIITVVDALPVFGTGTILIPWALALFLQGETKTGIGLVILYGAAALSRQALEPRLVGKQVGLNPVLTLLALYTGYRLLGVGGMIVFPIAAMLFKQLWDHSGLQPDG